MLSQMRKAEMVQSLKEDYVVLTDIVCEVIADIQADMLMLKKQKIAMPTLAEDKIILRKLDENYLKFNKKDPEKAVDIIEQIYELSDKYDKLRMAKDGR